MIDRYQDSQYGKKIRFIIGIAVNLGLLFYFKYFNFAAGILSKFLPVKFIKEVALPLGISFYTFQSISYIADLYMGRCKVQKSWINVSLYISFFPQLVAGPIIKYNDVNLRLTDRTITSDKTAYGIKRFIYGLGKKVLLSNYFGFVVDEIYGLQAASLNTAVSWFVAVIYAFQIYFDFSGYSDMAIGLGSMFGFDFPENFNYPFVSHSVQEFWRRWHISLSTWFKEYLYIPLGGNRKGTVRTYFNLIVVFFCTGFWHGASLQFIVWGLFHGAFLIIERAFLGKYLNNKAIRPFAHIYTVVEILTSFVIFRAPGLRYALQMFRNMFIFKAGGLYPLARFMNLKMLCWIIFAVVFCGVIQEKVSGIKNYVFSKKINNLEIIYLPLIYLLCIINLVSNTYNPFIYFRF